MAERPRMTAAQLANKLLADEHPDVLRDSAAWMAAELMEAEVGLSAPFRSPPRCGHTSERPDRPTARGGRADRPAPPQRRDSPWWAVLVCHHGGKVASFTLGAWPSGQPKLRGSYIANSPAASRALRADLPDSTCSHARAPVRSGAPARRCPPFVCSASVRRSAHAQRADGQRS